MHLGVELDGLEGLFQSRSWDDSPGVRFVMSCIPIIKHRFVEIIVWSLFPGAALSRIGGAAPGYWSFCRVALVS